MTNPENPAPLASMSIAELDAYRFGLGQFKLDIRGNAINAGLDVSTCYPLLAPYNAKIDAINAEQERRRMLRPIRANLERT